MRQRNVRHDTHHRLGLPRLPVVARLHGIANDELQAGPNSHCLVSARSFQFQYLLIE